jgi:hypothetical protein
MSITKHKLFQIPITSEIVLNDDGFNEMNSFLAEANYVYISHSISILTQSLKSTNTFRQVNKFLLISLVYKDLSETKMDIKRASKKAATVVKQSTEQNEKMPMPSYQTNFEKRNESKS